MDILACSIYSTLYGLIKKNILYPYHVLRLEKEMLIPVHKPCRSNVILGCCELSHVTATHLNNGITCGAFRDFQLSCLLDKNLIMIVNCQCKSIRGSCSLLASWFPLHYRRNIMNMGGEYFLGSSVPAFFSSSFDILINIKLGSSPLLQLNYISNTY